VFERCPVTIRRGKSQAPPQPERSQTWPRLVSYRARRREVRGRFLRALVLRVSFSKVANSARTEDGNRGGLGARLALDVGEGLIGFFRGTIPGNAGCPILPTIGPSRGAGPILAPTDRVGH
jgi:hypothetical protein